MYESPVLVLDDFKESVANESECEIKGFASEKSKSGREDNLDESRNSQDSNEADARGEKNGLVNCVASIEDSSVNKPSSEVLLPDPSICN